MQASFKNFLGEYGMLGVLLLLVVFFSFATIEEQAPIGADAAASVLTQIKPSLQAGKIVVVFGRANPQDKAFVEAVRSALSAEEASYLRTVSGTPQQIRAALSQQNSPISVLAAPDHQVHIAQNMKKVVASAKASQIITTARTQSPTFLRTDNLINIANQIVVIAIIAIGMSMVIITGGIDLSVGSLIAFSAVIAASLIGAWGGVQASTGAMFAACLLAILASGLIGVFSGTMVTYFKMPPFIATLSMMLVTSGFAYIFAGGQSIYQIPDAFVGLGRGTLVGIPIAVLLMGLLYVLGHIIMSKTTFGRYIYAVGGNQEAARLSGVNISTVLLSVYTISGLMAGLGGVILASQLKSGAPTYGGLYELYVIASVVVGGASLSGGQGKIFGTLIGAFIIGVIQNGMNLTGVESYTQKVVLGLVILGAVLLDTLRKRKG